MRKRWFQRSLADPEPNWGSRGRRFESSRHEWKWLHYKYLRSRSMLDERLIPGRQPSLLPRYIRSLIRISAYATGLFTFKMRTAGPYANHTQVLLRTAWNAEMLPPSPDGNTTVSKNLEHAAVCRTVGRDLAEFSTGAERLGSTGLMTVQAGYHQSNLLRL